MAHPAVDLWWWLTRPCPGHKLLFRQPYLLWGVNGDPWIMLRGASTIKTLPLIRWHDQQRGQVLLPGAGLSRTTAATFTSHVSQMGGGTWYQWWYEHRLECRYLSINWYSFNIGERFGANNKTNRMCDWIIWISLISFCNCTFVNFRFPIAKWKRLWYHQVWNVNNTITNLLDY